MGPLFKNEGRRFEKKIGNDDLKLRVNLYHFNQNGMENT